MGADTETQSPRMLGADRAKALADGVVAIAITLLILPLMESVSEAAGQGQGAAEWLGDHDGQMITFVISFVIVALLWMNHHQLFSTVESVTPLVLWLLVAWMLTIVWMPVATALTGQLPSSDPTAKALYIGSMILTTLVSLATRVVLAKRPDVHRTDPEAVRIGISVDLAMATLFTLSLVVALVVPGVDYFALFLMLLTSWLHRLYARLLGLPRPRPARG